MNCIYASSDLLRSMGLDVRGAFRYPRRTVDWTKNVFYGGSLLLLSGLFPPFAWPIYGYLMRTIRATRSGVDTAPEFYDWTDLTSEGFLSSLILLIYWLVATAGLVGAALMGEDTVGVVISSLLTIGSMLIVYLSFPAVISFALKEQFTSAFDLNRVIELGFSVKFVLAWVVAITSFIAINLLWISPIAFVNVRNSGLIAGIVALCWLLLWPFVVFYTSVVATRLLASGIDDSSTSMDGRSEEATRPEVDPMERRNRRKIIAVIGMAIVGIATLVIPIIQFRSREPPIAEGVDEVVLRDSQFGPPNIHIDSGSSVTWVNEDELESRTYGLLSGSSWEFETQLSPEESASYTFEESGIYVLYDENLGSEESGMRMKIGVDQEIEDPVEY